MLKTTRHETEILFNQLIGRSPREGEIFYRARDRWIYRPLDEAVSEAFSFGDALNAYTTDAESAGYPGIATGEAGNPYAGIVELEALRIAYENLRLAHDDLRAKLIATGVVT